MEEREKQALFLGRKIRGGAYLADGSECSGNYSPEVNLEKLKDFHRRRLQVLIEAGPDLLAFENIPNMLGAQACVSIPSWICFSSVDGEKATSGESFEDGLNVINKSGRVSAVGINCAPPHFVLSLIQRFKLFTIFLTEGVCFSAIRLRQQLKCFDDGKFELVTTRWRGAGASLIEAAARLRLVQFEKF
ncbi:homocysteine S-methyltransferase [Salvia divinorum]|uniref:Homocysteine S-methyltransferase n=1 Tax=Salvia divinorum TaxID=28513 RepID=A0ABD1HBN1_SALDI